MARNNHRSMLYNCILVVALLVMLGVSMLGGGSLTTLALEQETRCGMQEHSHNGDCYLGDVLLCSQKAHLHTEDCYLVLLRDNDINWLVQTMSETQEKSLEGVIDSALVQALNLNPAQSGEKRQTVYLASENISDLNRIIVESEIQPAVVLNENLSDEKVLMYTPPVIEEAEKVEETFPWPTLEVTRPTWWETTETMAPTEPTVVTEATTEVTTEPTETTTATEETTVPTEETTAPTEETTTPTESPTEPTEETTTPTESPTEPTEETTAPTESPTDPTEETTAPTESPTEPTEETTAPTESPTEPTEETTAPTESPTEPTEETTAPTESLTDPTEETTVPTESPTDPTEETTAPTESPTDPTEETTAPTEEPTEPTGEAPEYGKPEGPEPQYGEAGVYLLADDQWVCVDVLQMDAQQQSWGTNYTISTQTIRDSLNTAAVVSQQSLRVALVQTTQAPPHGLEAVSGVVHQTIFAGKDGTARHFFLASSEEVYEEESQKAKRVYTPIAYHTVTMVLPDEQEQICYVESGENLAPALSADYLWKTEDGAAVAADLPVIEPLTLYGVTPAVEASEDQPPDGETDEPAEQPADDTLEAADGMQVPEKLMLSAPMTLSAAAPAAAEAGSDVAAYAAELTPNRAKYGANFYIQLDGNPKLIGTNTLNNNRQIDTATVVNYYTSNTITGLQAGRLGSDYGLHYTANAGDWNFDGYSMGSYTNNKKTATFGSKYSSTSARYIILTNGSGKAINFYTVTFEYPNGETQSQYVQSGMASTLPMDFDTYNWYQGTQKLTQRPASVTGTVTYRAEDKSITATFTAPDGKELFKPDEKTSTDGGYTFSLPSLTGTPYEGWLWVVSGGDGTAYPGDGTAQVTLYEDTSFTVIPSTYTVTFEKSAEEISAITVKYREGFQFPDNLPEGYTWRLSDGSEYAPGDTYPSVTEELYFFAADREITVTYQVNFNQSGVTQNPVLVDSGGTTGETTVATGQTTNAKAVTPRIATQSINSTNECKVYFFKGWKVKGTNTLIEPDARLTWQELDAWENASGVVELVGEWSNDSNNGGLQSANFYIRYDSVAVDVNGNLTAGDTNKYTNSLHQTYVGGLENSQNLNQSQLNNAYQLTDKTADNSFTVDQQIRALRGVKTEGVWFYDFPTDEAVFAFLKNDPKVSNLQIDGEVVPINQLSTEYYAVRWYVFKKEGSSWHIDGKLVPREGHITITKRFNGDSTAVSAAKNDFYITAATQNRTERLTLSGAEKIGDAYKWKITGVHLGEQWKIQEFTTPINGYSYYAESLVYDTDGEMQPISRNGTQVDVTGKAYAIDVDPNQGMMVDFTNYYYAKDSILLKKEDAQTGRPIGGAVFQLYQNNSLLTFDYDESTGTYERNPEGTGTHRQIVTKSDGFSVISTTGFSYNMGDVTVKEVIAPDGYDPAPDIILGDNGGTIILKNVDGVESHLWSGFAEVPNNDTLIIKDQVSEKISVTVEKRWDTQYPAATVDVVLQANGQNAASVFPGFANAQIQLSDENAWTYTWSELPRVADGTPVTWSVKEVAIGGETVLADGTFPSWTAIHSPGIGTDHDSDGDVDEWSFTITNTQRRTQLIIIKTDTNNIPLKDATFTMQQVRAVNGAWQPVTGSLVTTQTSGSNGHLNFDTLKVGNTYLLTETNPPVGYAILTESIALSIDQAGHVWQVDLDGTRTEITAPGIYSHSGYTIRVENRALVNLPETGGRGTCGYTFSGMAMMLAAVYMIVVKRRREDRNTS